MFAVLQTAESKSVFSRSKIHSRRITLPSGEAFFIVYVSCRKNNIPWKKLERCLGVLRKDILLPDDIKIADKVNVTAFEPGILPGIILMNTAADYMLKNKPFMCGSLTVIDEKGTYQSYIEKLIKCFSSIKVITPKASEYEDVARRLLEDYGFSLLVSDEDSFESDVIISENCNVPSYYSGKVMSIKKKYIMNAEVFTGSGIELPEEYEKLCPDNIDRLLFASALYEKCGVKEMSSLRYSKFEC